ARARVWGFVKIVAVTDPQPVIHRQDDESAAREILIERVRVRVIVRVVPTEQHLPRWSAMDVDDGGLAGPPTPCARFEQLPMNRQPIGGAENDLPWSDEARGEVTRNVIGADRTTRAARGRGEGAKRLGRRQR